TIGEALAARGRDADFSPEQRLGRGPSERDQDLRAHEFDLALQIGQAGADLGRLRRAIVRRPALDRIRDIDVLAAAQADCTEHVVEQASRLADEGLALAVLLLARSLAHQHPAPRAVADAGYRLGASVAEHALPTGVDLRFERVPVEGRDAPRARIGSFG